MNKLLFILSICFSIVISAQSSIVADRPGAANPPQSVPKNTFQVETGLQYEHFSKDESATTHPTFLVRYGLSEFFEINFLGEVVTERMEDHRISGFTPLVFGFKGKIADEKNIFPAIGITGHISANKTGKQEFRTTNISSDLIFLFENSIRKKWTLGYNIGMEWDGENPYTTGIYALSLQYSFTEKFNGFGEFFGSVNKSQTADNQFDAGITYLVNDDLQLDVSAGAGLSEISPKYFILCGMAFRFR